jgi:2,3-bisphosphoglycerate-independent phosphoglycerate mutase
MLYIQKLTICITGDHSTPVRYGDHSHEPVPFLVGRSDLFEAFHNDKANNTDIQFGELACAEGCLGRFYGGDIMKLLLCYARD